MNVKCPRCGQPAEFSPANPHRPFCSERCQTLDLGAWAEEKYRVPDEEIDPATVNENTRRDPSDDDDPPLKH